MKRFIVNTTVLVILVLVSGLVYVRLAPDDIAMMHVLPPVGAATPDNPVLSRNGVLFAEDFQSPPAKLMEMVEKVANDTPRTQLVGGKSGDDFLTFVTRSLVFGFPDYTTVRAVPMGKGTRLIIMARLRYGQSDFGVNEARVRAWLKDLKALDQAG